MRIGIGNRLGSGGTATAVAAPTVSWSTPADASSVYWGGTTTLAISVTAGTGTITGVTWRLGSGTPEAMVDGGGGAWSKAHVWQLAEIGASQTLTATVTTSDGLTVTATRTITIVDPFVAFSVTHWRFDENTTVQSATHSTDVSTWTRTGIASVTDQGGGYYRVTEDTSTGGHDVRATVSNLSLGPASIGYRIKKASTVSHVRIGTFESASYIRISDGAVLAGVGSHTMTVTDGGDHWQVIHRPALMNASSPLLIPQLADGGVISYAGTGKWAEWAMFGADGLSAGTIQQRGSDVNERVGTYGNFLQATADSQPFLWNSATNTWSQAAGLLFNGSEHMIAGSGTAAQPHSVVLVWQAANAAGTYGVYSGGTSTAGNMTTASSLISISGGTSRSTGQAPETSPMVSVSRYNGTTSWHRKNGAQTADLSCGTSSRTGGLMVGQINGGTPTLTGRILDVGFAADGLTAEQAGHLERALVTLPGRTGITLAA